jgi:hypothetical protein
MPISNTEPVIVPQTEQKTFPHIWIKDIQISAPSSSEGYAIFQLCPYNAETQEILDQSKTIFIEDLWGKINESPQFQQAMGAIFAAVETIK